MARDTRRRAGAKRASGQRKTNADTPAKRPRRGDAAATPSGLSPVDRRQQSPANQNVNDFEYCLVCKAQLASVYALKMHYIEKHSRLPNMDNDDCATLTRQLESFGFLKCPQCAKEMKNLPGYRRHRKWCGRETETLMCCACGKLQKAMWMVHHRHRCKAYKNWRRTRGAAKRVATGQQSVCDLQAVSTSDGESQTTSNDAKPNLENDYCDTLTGKLKVFGFLKCPRCAKEMKNYSTYWHHGIWCGRETETLACSACGTVKKAMWMAHHKRKCRAYKNWLKTRRTASPMATQHESVRDLQALSTSDGELQTVSGDSENFNDCQTCVICEAELESLDAVKVHYIEQHTRLWNNRIRQGCENVQALEFILKVLGFLKCQRCQQILNNVQGYRLHIKWCGRKNEVQTYTPCSTVKSANLLRRKKKVCRSTFLSRRRNRSTAPRSTHADTAQGAENPGMDNGGELNQPGDTQAETFGEQLPSPPPDWHSAEQSVSWQSHPAEQSVSVQSLLLPNYTNEDEENRDGITHPNEVHTYTPCSTVKSATLLRRHQKVCRSTFLSRSRNGSTATRIVHADTAQGAENPGMDNGGELNQPGDTQTETFEEQLPSPSPDWHSAEQSASEQSHPAEQSVSDQSMLMPNHANEDEENRDGITHPQKVARNTLLGRRRNRSTAARSIHGDTAQGAENPEMDDGGELNQPGDTQTESGEQLPSPPPDWHSAAQSVSEQSHSAEQSVCDRSVVLPNYAIEDEEIRHGITRTMATFTPADSRVSSVTTRNDRVHGFRSDSHLDEISDSDRIYDAVASYTVGNDSISARSSDLSESITWKHVMGDMRTNPVQAAAQCYAATTSRLPLAAMLEINNLMASHGIFTYYLLNGGLLAVHPESGQTKKQFDALLKLIQQVLAKNKTYVEMIPKYMSFNATLCGNRIGATVRVGGHCQTVGLYVRHKGVAYFVTAGHRFVEADNDVAMGDVPVCMSSHADVPGITPGREEVRLAGHICCFRYDPLRNADGESMLNHVDIMICPMPSFSTELCSVRRGLDLNAACYTCRCCYRHQCDCGVPPDVAYSVHSIKLFEGKETVHCCDGIVCMFRAEELVGEVLMCCPRDQHVLAGEVLSYGNAIAIRTASGRTAVMNNVLLIKSLGRVPPAKGDSGSVWVNPKTGEAVAITCAMGECVDVDGETTVSVWLATLLHACLDALCYTHKPTFNHVEEFKALATSK